ncbi:MAG: hypothetical protein HQ567_21495 [Candidatus Nealsonbacteria bacterium]|nr:hypothetical protein [Candidatus Nealsonbacteria bacterium]
MTRHAPDGGEKDSPAGDPSLPLAAKERIDKICVAFEQVWQADEHQRSLRDRPTVPAATGTPR